MTINGSHVLEYYHGIGTYRTQ